MRAGEGGEAGRGGEVVVRGGGTAAGAGEGGMGWEERRGGRGVGVVGVGGEVVRGVIGAPERC